MKRITLRSGCLLVGLCLFTLVGCDPQKKKEKAGPLDPAAATSATPTTEPTPAKPEQTAAALRDGWMFSGDAGYMDEDGYVFIVDRKKDIIIRGGENISCTELEQAIYAHPDVIECSAFGLPDARLGEVPAAVFRPRPARDVTADDLREFLAERLASFKIPQHLWRVEDELPRLATQKVDRRTLRNRYLELSGNR